MTSSAELPHRQIAPAKINLALHVTGRRDDGYHLLDSLVAFADYGDRLIFHESDETILRVDGPFAAGLDTENDNLIHRACRALAEAVGRELGSIGMVLEKNLPVASGIGGGSADAAAALRGLAEINHLDISERDLNAIALKLGADVPVCIGSQACRMRGIGEDIGLLPGFPSLPAVLVNPGIAVSTADIFGRLGLAVGASAFDGLPEGVSDVQSAADAIDWLGRCRNDLEMPATAVAPLVGSCLDDLGKLSSARLVRMSGSGATCFALFESIKERDEAAEALRESRSSWWIQPVILS